MTRRVPSGPGEELDLRRGIRRYVDDGAEHSRAAFLLIRNRIDDLVGEFHGFRGDGDLDAGGPGKVPTVYEKVDTREAQALADAALTDGRVDHAVQIRSLYGLLGRRDHVPPPLLWVTGDG